MLAEVDVAVVVTTYFPPGDIGSRRMDAALAAVRSWDARLRNAKLGWMVADDGSEAGHLEEFSYMITRLTEGDWENVGTNRLGCGGALNAGIRRAFDLFDTDTVFYAQDDWELTEPLDLDPSLLLLDAGIADIVRIGMTHPNLTAHVVRTDLPGCEWCLQYEWAGGGYVFSWRPALYHRRLFDRFGYFAEGVSAIEAERQYLVHLTQAMFDERYTIPVFHAPNCTLVGPFRHIETTELGEDDPATLTARYAGG